MFTWWYLHGWSVFIHKLRSTISNVTDFFSMSDLLRTLFQPFRQISAETAASDSSLDIKFHMFIDRLISRFVGFFSRLLLLIAGTIIIIVSCVVSLALIILWPFIPLAPIAGIILAITGVTLWTIILHQRPHQHQLHHPLQLQHQHLLQPSVNQQLVTLSILAIIAFIKPGRSAHSITQLSSSFFPFWP